MSDKLLFYQFNYLFTKQTIYCIVLIIYVNVLFFKWKYYFFQFIFKLRRIFMNTGDASYIKQLNRRILIEEIIKNRSLSRSDLARITGLNKATVSAQVSDLIAEKS
ncbi:winged helix-turn-helix transcriptional regulator [Oceanobacillus sp. 143]|nr:winged helix-turn-helix transcriptional regulator [Oceanobacillus sp. 143]